MVCPTLNTKNICIAIYLVVFSVTLITIISVVATSNARNSNAKIKPAVITTTSTKTVSTTTESIESTSGSSKTITTSETTEDASTSTSTDVITTEKTNDTTVTEVTTTGTTNNPRGFCEIKGFSGRSPLPIYTGSNVIMYPDSGAIRILDGETVEFACPGDQVTVNQIPIKELLLASCVNGVFKISKTMIAVWEKILCLEDKGHPTILLLKEDDSMKDCFTNKSNHVASIGMQLDDKRYSSFVKICFNMDIVLPLYSYYNISGALKYQVMDETKEIYKADNRFYNFSVNSCYKNINNAINDLMNNKSFTDKIFVKEGHLAARSDFFYTSLQTSTDQYINIAPQWNTFGEGNWRQIEETVRNYTINKKIDLQIWTGTFGVARLNDKDLYLKDQKALPVPAVFWKLVYDSNNKKGVVFVGHNNPYLDISKSSDFKICNDITKELNWISIDQSDATKGFSYACDYNDVKNKITYLPQIVVSNILD